MAGLYVKQDDVWKLPKSIWVKSDTWHVCKNVYMKQGGSWREMIKTVTLTSDKTNFNLWKHVGSPTQPLSLIFNINDDVTISSSGSSGGYRTTAFTVGDFPNGSTVIINNNGMIAGGGGDGGTGGRGYQNQTSRPVSGGNGGYGLIKGSSKSYDCTLVNNGTIAGGGGGGGGGSAGDLISNVVGDGGTGGDGAGISGYAPNQGQSGGAGTCVTAPPIAGGGTSCGSAGGAGGSNGQDGESGGGSGASGGKGRKAILTSGIEIAVSGDIDGGVE
jgi:hypothetical protein